MSFLAIENTINARHNGHNWTFDVLGCISQMFDFSNCNVSWFKLDFFILTHSTHEWNKLLDFLLIISIFILDICIGTELKFEDSLIGKHSSAQTHGKCRICGSSLESFNQALYGYFESNSINTSCVNHKAFVCKVPNVQPFIMTMKSNIRSSEEPAED